MFSLRLLENNLEIRGDTMFFTMYKYRLKHLFRDKITMFWLLIYPLLMATIFNLCFKNLLQGEVFEKINIAVENTSSISTDIKNAMEKSELFNIKLVNSHEGKELLDSNHIDAFVTIDKNTGLCELSFKKEGLNQSITKVFFDSYTQISSTISNIVKSGAVKSPEEVFSKIDLNKTYVENVPVNSSNNVTVIYFYSLFAMTCFFCITLGVDISNEIQANQSNIACRLCIGPVNKFKILMSLLAGSMTFHIISIILTLLYMTLVLQIDFGSQLGLVFLIGVVGSFCGMSIGCSIGAAIVKKDGMKMGLAIGITLLCSFLSGMMNIEIKYHFSSKFPILSRLNPVGLITDGLYSLYYYGDTLDRYVSNIIILIIIGVIFSMASFLLLRRQKYESI